MTEHNGCSCSRMAIRKIWTRWWSEFLRLARILFCRLRWMKRFRCSSRSCCTTVWPWSWRRKTRVRRMLWSAEVDLNEFFIEVPEEKKALLLYALLRLHILKGKVIIFVDSLNLLLFWRMNSQIVDISWVFSWSDSPWSPWCWITSCLLCLAITSFISSIE